MEAKNLMTINYLISLFNIWEQFFLQVKTVTNIIIGWDGNLAKLGLCMCFYGIEAT